MKSKAKIETALLSEIISSDNASILNHLSEDEFSIETNSKIFEYIKSYHARNKKFPSIESCNTKFNVTLTHERFDLMFLIDELIEKKITKSFIQILRDASEAATKNGNIREVVRDMNDAISTLTTSISKTETSLDDDIEHLIKTKGLVGVPFGIAEIDDITHGAGEGDLISILAFTGEGKTTIAALLTVLIYRQGFKTFIASLEQPKNQIMRIVTAIASGVSLDDLRDGDLSKKDTRVIDEFIKEFKATPLIVVDDSPLFGIGDLRRCVIKHQPDVVIIDYLALMQGDYRENDKTKRLDELVRRLKIEARQLRVPIIILVQGTKETGAQNRPPRLDQVEGGMPVAKTSDVILSFVRNGSLYDFVFRKNRKSTKRTRFQMRWTPNDGINFAISNVAAERGSDIVAKK